MFIFSSNKGKGFVVAHLSAIIIFALLYYISDLLLHFFPQITRNMGLGHLGGEDPQTLFYFTYYSLITQSTVGYAGGKAGKAGFEMVTSNIFKILNFIQIISIFIITGYYF